MIELVRYLAQNLGDHPEDVRVTDTGENGEREITLQVHQEDMCAVIGKNGRTIRAIRALMASASAKKGDRASLKLEICPDSEGEEFVEDASLPPLFADDPLGFTPGSNQAREDGTAKPAPAQDDLTARQPSSLKSPAPLGASDFPLSLEFPKDINNSETSNSESSNNSTNSLKPADPLSPLDSIGPLDPEEA
jgi:predicted RNA-binding protein YlqC (UPF0109 family)